MRITRGRLILLAISCVALVAFWPHLYCLLAIAWNYIWWPLFSSSVRMVTPLTANVAVGGPETLVVPAILHQTWRDGDIPTAWREAQDSCRRVRTGTAL